FDSATKKVTVDYSDVTCNNEAYDAFYTLSTFQVKGAQTENVVLTRPFAQINIGTNDYEDSRKAGYVPTQSTVTVSDIYNVLNLWNGEVTGETSVTFKADAIDRNQDFPVPGYEYIAMNYVLVPSTKRLVDVEFTYTDGTDAKTRTVGSVPVQRNYRTNIYGQLLTSDVDINVTIDPIYEGENPVDGKYTYFVVDTDEKLKAALTSNHEHIYVELTGDVTYDVAAWDTYAMGGDKTNSITINGEKVITRGTAPTRILTFNQTNSDWNNIATKNGAKLILKNLNVTNEGHNNGPWNRHDLNFACDVEMENVVSDKAIALKAGGVLNGVTINDENTSDTYALWIQPNGQVVTLNGCTINMPAEDAGRGIKIDEQYVDEVKAPTLNVSGTTFITKEKAAVLVKSVDGAIINWGVGNSITQVKADSEYPVWIDEDAAAYADKVIVNGASVRIEGSIVAKTEDELKNALAKASYIYLAAGEYKFPTSSFKAGQTLICEEGVVFTGLSKLNIKGATVIGAKFSNPSGTAVDQTINGTFKNCTFEGSNALRSCYAGETVVFENCVFSGSVYGIHFDGGENDAIFRKCQISGFNAFGAKLTQLTLEGCTFVGNGKSGYNGANLWGSAKMIACEFTFNGTAATEWIDCIGADKTYEFTNCTVNGVAYTPNNYTEYGKIFSRVDKKIVKINGVDCEM
ncbi:MAG: right-handed parallel beta-helix repeat-containing protein, partial [Muribaculaceae bacterium]|nr:right-handed parallel beta-helix repeat-containing protein [Muribaculaceae bacterium]